MKYKVGDEVLVKGSIVKIECEEYDACPVAVGFDKGRSEWYAEEELIPVDKTYTQGLADAWELAKKILYGNDKQLIEIFGLYVDPAYFDLTHKRAIINDRTPEEALAKIEAYEKGKEIKVGDVVVSRDAKRKFLVVTEEDDDSIYEFGVIDLKTMTLDRICNYPKGFTKTGKHIDIESLLKQIGE